MNYRKKYTRYNDYNDQDQDQHYQEEDDQREEMDQVGFQEKKRVDFELFASRRSDLPDFPKNQKIKRYATSSQVRIIITESNKVFRWKFKQQKGYLQYDLHQPREQNIGKAIFSVMKSKQKNINLTNIFIQASGVHTIITGQSNNQPINYYFNIRDNKVRCITKIKGFKIKSLAWYNPTPQSTGQILLGIQSKNNMNIGFSLITYQVDFNEQLTQHNPQIKLKMDQTLNNLILIRLSQKKSKILILIICTAKGFYCLYNYDQISILFNNYNNKQNKLSLIEYKKGFLSQMQYYQKKQNIGNRVQAIIYTNGINLIEFVLPQFQEQVNQKFLMNDTDLFKNHKKRYLQTPKTSENQYLKQFSVYPLNIGISEFHYYILYSDCLTIVSRISQKVIKVIQFSGKDQIVDMIMDSFQKCYWIYSTQRIYKLDISKQDIDAWKLLIEKKKYKLAYNVCKKVQENVQYIATLYADEVFRKGNYKQAALLYCETNKSFQEIFIKYLNVDSYDGMDGLEVYLKIWLNKLYPDQKTQRTLILSWITQILVYKLNLLKKEKKLNVGKQRNDQLIKFILQNEQQLQRLIKKYNEDINENVAFEVCTSHGRFQTCLQFADKKGKYDIIIIHYINQQNYKVSIPNKAAIKKLKQISDPKIIQTIYKYAHILMKYQMVQMNQLMIKYIKNFIPQKMIQGLVNIPTDQRVQGIKFIQYCVHSFKVKDKDINNIMIFFYTTIKKNKNQELLDFLKKTSNFDYSFALKLVKRANFRQAQILIYGTMQMYNQAVNLALQDKKFQLAKQYAVKPIDDQKKKKLWLQIAKYLLSQQNSQVDIAINLTKVTDLIKIEDLLPYFNENIKIEHFKQQICNSLKGYNQHIEKLKSQMQSYSKNAEQLKGELKKLKYRYIQIDNSNKCQQCFKGLTTDEFYIFPCMHGFHKQCLVKAFKQQPIISNQEIYQISSLDRQVQMLKNKTIVRKKQADKQAGFFGSFDFFGFKSKVEQQVTVNLSKQQQMLSKKKTKFDKILASQCIYCGPRIVDSILIPFNNEQRKRSWKI